MSKAFITFYLTIIFLLFFYLYFTHSDKNQSEISHKPVASEAKVSVLKSIDTLKHHK